MSNLKISQLTPGNPAQGGDSIPIARGGANYFVTAASIAALGGGGGGNGVTLVDNETPGGSVDGTNVTFTLVETPLIGTVNLYWNGLRVEGFSVTGSTLTLNTPPLSGDTLIADYSFLGASGFDANIPLNSQTGTTYSIQDSDRGSRITFSNASPVAVNLAQANSGGNFISGWYVFVENINTSLVTITPSTSTINGWPTIVLAQWQWALILSDGTNYQAFFTQISSTDPASALTAYVTNDAGIGAAQNQIVVRDINSGVDSKRKALNIYLEHDGAESGNPNYSAFQVNAGFTADSHTVGLGAQGQTDAGEFNVAASGAAMQVLEINAVKARVTVTGSAVVTNATAFLCYLPQVNSGSTLANFTGFLLDAPAGGGTITNAVGVNSDWNLNGVTFTTAIGGLFGVSGTPSGGGFAAAVVADDGSAQNSFIGHGTAGTLHDGWYGGNGSPAGVIVAAVGSIYSRQDGGAGTSLYVKESGTGTSTGWTTVTTGGGGGGGGTGWLAPTWSAVSTTSTLSAAAQTVACTGGVGGITITLSTSPTSGQTHYLTKVDSAVGAITIDWPVATPIFELTMQNQFVWLSFDGTAWRFLGLGVV